MGKEVVSRIRLIVHYDDELHKIYIVGICSDGTRHSMQLQKSDNITVIMNQQTYMLKGILGKNLVYSTFIKKIHCTIKKARYQSDIWWKRFVDLMMKNNGKFIKVVVRE